MEFLLWRLVREDEDLVAGDQHGPHGGEFASEAFGICGITDEDRVLGRALLFAGQEGVGSVTCGRVVGRHGGRGVAENVERSGAAAPDKGRERRGDEGEEDEELEPEDRRHAETVATTCCGRGYICLWPQEERADGLRRTFAAKAVDGREADGGEESEGGERCREDHRSPSTMPSRASVAMNEV